jgi:hypothetical protein
VEISPREAFARSSNSSLRPENQIRTFNDLPRQLTTETADARAIIILNGVSGDAVIGHGVNAKWHPEAIMGALLSGSAWICVYPIILR